MWPPDEEEPNVADVPDAQSLWRLLVIVTTLRELAPSVAIDTFRRLHGAGQPGPVDSALLLCTDWRWRRTSSRVLAGILATEILNDEQQDQLAEELLWPEKATYEYPLGWLGSTFIEIDLSPTARAPKQRTVHEDPTTPMTAERRVWPPLRAWAAERVVSRSLATPCRRIGPYPRTTGPRCHGRDSRRGTRRGRTGFGPGTHGGRRRIAVRPQGATQSSAGTADQVGRARSRANLGCQRCRRHYPSLGPESPCHPGKLVRLTGSLSAPANLDSPYG
ncbi:hypothetical protein [Fodinicola feengrottensis]|uniref:hypothetical protein n=1 Tax=Fodinicola feengrottensis TaxID=435914 RepID=UPI0013D32942|nr:hypothetical protein [Fodinicola feengrottensis]